MSEFDDELEASGWRRPLVTVLLGLGVLLAILFYFLREPSYAPTGDAFIDAACALGDEAMAGHLCLAVRADANAERAGAPVWYSRITTVPAYVGNSGYNEGVNSAIDLSTSFEADGEPVEAAKARLYAALVAMEMGEIGGARGQLEDIQMLLQGIDEGDGSTIRHLTGLYLAQISWRLGDFEDGHDEIRAFASRAIDLEPYLQASAAREFAGFIRSEEFSDVYEWVIEDYRLIREIYEAAEDWRRFGIAWYLQGGAEAATGDYRRASVTYTTTAEVFARTGFKELQAESQLRHAEMMREHVPSLAASLEREAANIFTGVGIDPRAAQMDPLNLVLYEPDEAVNQ